VAEEAQVKLLKEKGVKAWNEWRSRDSKIRASLSTEDVNSSFGVEVAYPVNLSGADLRGVDLRGANFFLANLCATDLSDANLYGAKLDTTAIYGANMSGAVLLGASFNGAGIDRVNFSNADLRGAAFHHSNIGEADFNNSSMSSTQFIDVDLRGCKGLETVKHAGPSAIDIATVFRSAGNISEVFLRGAGVPEPFIGYMRSLVAAMSPVQFFSCFISYSHADKAFARRLHDALQAKGVRCRLDEHQLLPGDDIYHEVDRGIRLWDKMLLCCSEHSLTSWWVDNEIGTAFEKEQQLMKDRGAKVQVLVPLNLDGYLFGDKWNSQHGYQAQIKRRLAADFTEIGADASKFDVQVERLIRALRADEGAREKPPKQRL
jgi:hypothetical protein